MNLEPHSHTKILMMDESMIPVAMQPHTLFSDARGQLNCSEILVITDQPTTSNPVPNSDELGCRNDSPKLYSALLEANPVTLTEQEKEKYPIMLECKRMTRQGRCQCIHNYVRGKTSSNTLEKDKMLHLNAIMKKSAVLSQQKAYDVNNPQEKRNKTLKKNRTDDESFLGRGHLKSSEFEEFVLSNRKFLRKEAGLCEKACQQILKYSNNFLHKKIKCRPKHSSRIEKKAASLHPINVLKDLKCCGKGCTSMAVSHQALLERWRAEASISKRRQRVVIGYMLTPAGGCHRNCYLFIQMVTGASRGVIAAVSEQMKQNGGIVDPPVHGLKKAKNNQVEKQDARIKS